MSLQRFIEGECGGANHLMRVASHVTQDQAFRQDGLLSKHLASSLDPREEMAPDSFHMGSLLEKLQETEAAKVGPIHEPPLQRDGAWNQAIRRPESSTSETHLEQFWQSENSSGLSNWVKGFPQAPSPVLPEAIAFPYHRVEHIWHSVPEIPPTEAESGFPLATDFLNAAAVEDETLKADDASGDVSQLLNSLGGDFDDDVAWGKVFADQAAKSKDKTKPEEATKEKQDQSEESHRGIWDSLQSEWDKIMTLDDEKFWLTEGRRHGEYDYVEENPFIDHSSPFEEGCKKLSEGDIPSAVLFFEAATKQDAEHVEAWQYLGTTQAQNEQDTQAIAALEKCIALQPHNLTALMALAVSYTNESLGRDACITLKRWLDSHPNYRHLSAETNADEIFKQEAVVPWVSRDIHNKICELLQKAADLSAADPDPDVQCALGVLYNLSGEHEKAVESFQEALKVRGDDYLLWNKLGASLANGNRSDEAIKAYYNALHLAPGCIRSRFNLGVSCLNLKAYKEAAEHFLTALNIQATARGLDGRTPQKSMSDSIWNSLRMVVTLLDKPHLIPLLNDKDLARLNKELELE